ncbi:hypothetical protein ACQY0O_007905 [Thecaphora frezii]
MQSREAPPASPASQLSSSPRLHHNPHFQSGGGYSHTTSGYQRSPLASPSAFPPPPNPAYGVFSSLSANRPPPAPHQLQHPDHSTNNGSGGSTVAPGGRASPYSSPQLRGFSHRPISQRSSPEPGHAPSHLQPPQQQQHPGHHAGPSSLNEAPLPASPLVNSGDLSDASQGHVATTRRDKPLAKKRKTEAETRSSREASVDPARAGASSDGKDAKPTGRVAKACQPCSTKKRRCDGRQPECSVCQVLGSPCTYNHTGLKRGPPKGFRAGPKESAKAKLIRSLETTVRDLISHLGKDDAGSEILRVAANRELGLSKDSGDGQRRNQVTDVGQTLAPGSAVKVEVSEGRTAGSRGRTDGDGAGNGEEPYSSDASGEDVIGDTRMGELVYRGSSSGIGVLQRHQHRAESPAPPLASTGAATSANASGQVGSAASGSRTGRPRLESAGQRLGRKAGQNLQGPPVFVPIASPRAGSHHSAGGETPTSAHAPSPNLRKLSPTRENPTPRLPAARARLRDADAVGAEADPVVLDEEHARLFRYYWQGFHPFWPLLYKPSIASLPVEQLRHELDPCLLFAIYAIAACIIPGSASSGGGGVGASTDAEAEADVHAHHHQRAQLFSEAAERHTLSRGLRPDIPTIQSCWLLCLYSHGTGDLSRAWNFQNLASSMAVDLGLHRWPIYRSEIVDDPLQRETRIRLIWHCYIMDKVLCAEMGRPVGLRAKDCDVPLLSETEADEFELWSEPAEDGQPVPVQRSGEAPRYLHAPSCLNWGIHLFKIVERILDEVHSLRRKALLRKQGKQKVLAGLDKELTEWQAKLPKHLHLDQEARDGPLPSFFALNLWYYTARLLLHRPFIPQEEGLALSVVLANDSHQKSTEAANTICDLLEKSSTDFVDRLSTDLGYCLFTAAVMFVFNARLPDPQISSDARRRYGLCRKWLKKLADTWPAASAQKMLLDGFALVGEDASKATETPARRPSVAALGMLQQQQLQQQQQQQMVAGQGFNGSAGTNVSAWIAETDAATKAQGSTEKARPPGPPAEEPQRRHPTQPASSGRIDGQAMGLQPDRAARLRQPAAVNAAQNGPQFAFQPAGSQQTPSFNPAELHFAPGIFDVESFFWNENIAMTGPFMQPTAGAYQYPGAAPPQHVQHLNPFGGLYNPGHAVQNRSGGVPSQQDGKQGGSARGNAGVAANNAPQQQQPAVDGLSMLAQVTNERHPISAPPSGQGVGHDGFVLQRGPGVPPLYPGYLDKNAASAVTRTGAAVASQPPQPQLPVLHSGSQQPRMPNIRIPGAVGVQAQQQQHQQQQQGGSHTGMTPFVYPVDGSGNAAATAASMGEFWSMLELPPTFL